MPINVTVTCDVCGASASDTSGAPVPFRSWDVNITPASTTSPRPVQEEWCGDCRMYAINKDWAGLAARVPR